MFKDSAPPATARSKGYTADQYDMCLAFVLVPYRVETEVMHARRARHITALKYAGQSHIDHGIALPACVMIKKTHGHPSCFFAQDTNHRPRASTLPLVLRANHQPQHSQDGNTLHQKTSKLPCEGKIGPRRKLMRIGGFHIEMARSIDANEMTRGIAGYPRLQMWRTETPPPPNKVKKTHNCVVRKSKKRRRARTEVWHVV